MVSASTFARANSRVFVIIFVFLYFSNNLLTVSLSLDIDINKSNIIFSPGIIFTVLFIAKPGSVTNPNFLEKGLDSFTISGINSCPLPKNFSLFISNSSSPIVSCSV